ncbi:putative porin [uncultured Porphyromonas sp.]|uniref:putative porin n=1 Tax=uncultured Porphyromonas sp. TaxID=159274 RepID=UPI002614B0E2|nr:putative porin [uncultured Porphyromonas sp.]
MKIRTSLSLLLLFLSWASAFAQEPRRTPFDPYRVEEVQEIPDEIKMVRGDKLRAYKMIPDVARAVRVEMPDTLTHYTFEYISPEFRSLGVSYQGNLNHVWQAKLFFDRPRRVSDFFYLDGYHRMLYTPEAVRFYDTKTPFTFVRYQRNFQTNESADVVAGDFGVNLGKSLNVGANFDYQNIGGFYTQARSKDARYRVFASYRGDRYELYAYVANDYYKQEENGGITNADYIYNPERYTNSRTKVGSRDVPVLINSGNLTNRVRSGHGYLAHSYRLGSYRTAPRKQAPSSDAEGMLVSQDSTYFVPVGAISLTTYYNKQRRRFFSHTQNELWGTVFGTPTITHKRKQSDGTEESYTLPNDTAQLVTLQNTVALSLMEGFRPWVKFGLSAYLRHENRWATLPDRTTHRYAKDVALSSTFIGGLIERREGTGLNFSARGELGILGDDLGAFKLEGDIRTAFRLFRKRFALEADAYVDNARPSYFAAHHHGTYGWWDKDLKFTRRVELGGKVHLASWGTSLEARTASLQNYIYFDSKGETQQHTDLMQVLSFRARQMGSTGPLNWELEAAYQQSSNTSVLPLPLITAAADVYLRFLIAKVMRVDLGVKGYWHTAYKAPYYLPTNQQFALQTEGNVGGEAPLLIAYANFRLKRARFFLQMYNVGEALMANERLSMYKYPYNPMHLAAGVVVDLNN